MTRATIGLDDWLMLASLFLTIGMGVMLVVGKYKTNDDRMLVSFALMPSALEQVVRYMLWPRQLRKAGSQMITYR